MKIEIEREREIDRERERERERDVEGDEFLNRYGETIYRWFFVIL